MADIVVVDVGRYGFVMLKYYMPPHGFEEDETYTDSRNRPVKEMDKEMDSVGAASYAHFHDAAFDDLLI